MLARSDAENSMTVSNEQQLPSMSIGNAAINNETSKNTTAKKSIESQSINELTVDDDLPPLPQLQINTQKMEKLHQLFETESSSV